MDIKINELVYKYQVHTPFERLALHNINLQIPNGQYLAVVGHTGSGKSTLLQHLNALLQPTSGSITIGNRTITAGKKEKQLRPVRQKVGIVFQFPEHQLFEETVEKDICFGPINFGVSKEEAKERARELVSQLGLPDGVLEKSPFDLSGGQMRRVAIAGVLAMNPDVLVLDEPTAGLDPRGRKEIMDLFYQLHKEKNLTTILVTHSMEDAAMYADKIAVMQKGQLKQVGSPREIFSESEALQELGLRVPEVVQFQFQLEEKLQAKLDQTCLTIDELSAAISRFYKRGEAQ